MRDGNDINQRVSLHIPKAGPSKLNICCWLGDFTQQNRVGGANYSPEPEGSMFNAQVKVHKLPPQVEFSTTAMIRSIKSSFVKIVLKSSSVGYLLFFNLDSWRRSVVIAARLLPVGQVVLYANIPIPRNSCGPSNEQNSFRFILETLIEVFITWTAALLHTLILFEPSPQTCFPAPHIWPLIREMSYFFHGLYELAFSPRLY